MAHRARQIAGKSRRPTRDITGADEATHFNVWRWVEEMAEKDSHGAINPKLVMTFASAPIATLAQDWHNRFLQWQHVG